MIEWRDEDRRALQDVARVAREAAARDGVAGITGSLLEAVADTLTVRDTKERAEPKGPPGAEA